MELEALRRLVGRCDPREPLEDEDERYVDVDHILDDDGRELRPRRHAWVDHIARYYELAGKPQRLLLTGLPGSGKSTELRRVAARLERVDGARLLPVSIDAEKVIDVDQPIDVPDLVLAILAEAEGAVLKLEGRGDEGAGHESRFGRLWNFVTKTEVELEGLSAQGVVARLRSDPSLREQVRKSVAARTTEFLAQARAQMQALEERVRVYEVRGQPAPGQIKYAGLFVVFDSLEKLRGISSNFKEVLNSVETVMGRGAEHLDLGVHTLLTVPLAVVRRIEGVRVMPLIKYREPDTGAPFEPGLRALRRIVERRLGPETEAIFGPNAEDRLAQLIAQSGGYPRELITLLQNAVIASPMSDADFRHLLAERANEYERKVPRDAIDLLRLIADTRGPFVVESTQPELEEALITRSLVMVYQNQREWTDVNPAIAQLLQQWPKP